MFLPISLSTTGSLLLKLAGTVTTTQPTYSCTYADTLPESIQTVSGNLNNTTAVTAVDSPATGSRIVQQVTVYNKDTENVTLIVEVDDGTPHEYVRITLEPGDFLNKEGVFSSEGFIKAGVRGNTGAVSAAAGLILEHVASPPSTDAEETAIFVDVADGKPKYRDEDDGAVHILMKEALERNSQTGTTYTLALADSARGITLDNADAITLTVPSNGTVPFPVGTQILLVQLGEGDVTIEEDTGVTVNSLEDSLVLRGQFASATLWQIATNEWLLMGALA